MDLPLAEVVESRVAMRFVDKGRIEYQQLRDAMGRTSWCEPITVRVRADGLYEIVHGLQRYSVAKELTWDKIPASIVELNDEESIKLAVMANSIHVTPKPVEYAHLLRQLLATHPHWTVGYLAGLLCQTPGWVKQQLGLLKLHSDVQKDVDRGLIPLRNAYLLSLAPSDWQLEYATRARTANAHEIEIEFMGPLKSWHARMMSNKWATQEFRHEPLPLVRPIKILVAALDKPSVADTMTESTKCDSLADAFRLGVRWAIRLDDEAVQQQTLAAQRRHDKYMQAEARRKRERLLRSGQKSLNVILNSESETKETNE